MPAGSGHGDPAPEKKDKGRKTDEAILAAEVAAQSCWATERRCTPAPRPPGSTSAYVMAEGDVVEFRFNV